jgi:Leucine-rich repeat (LRR) protein
MNVLPQDTLFIVFSNLRIKQVISACSRVNRDWQLATNEYFRRGMYCFDVAKEAMFELKRFNIVHQHHTTHVVNNTKRSKKNQRQSSVSNKKHIELTVPLEQDAIEKMALKSLIHYLLVNRSIERLDEIILDSCYLTMESCLDLFPVDIWRNIKRIVVGHCIHMNRKLWYLFLKEPVGLISLDLSVRDLKYFRMNINDVKDIILKHKQTLTSLSLQNIDVDGLNPIVDFEFVKDTLVHCDNLAFFKLTHADYFGSRALKILSDSCTHLTELSLARFDGSLKPIGNLQKLRKLTLIDCHICSLCTLHQISSLILRDCFIHIDKIAEICMDDDVDDNDMIVDIEITEDTMFNIGRLNQLKHLEFVRVNNCNYASFCMDSANEFEQQFTSLKQLDSLIIHNLKHCDMLSTLAQHCRLTSLTLIACNFDTGESELKNNFIQVTKTLQHLTLEYCNPSMYLFILIFSESSRLRSLRIVMAKSRHSCDISMMKGQLSDLRKLTLMGIQINIHDILKLRRVCYPRLHTIKLSGKGIPDKIRGVKQTVKKKHVTYRITDL